MNARTRIKICGLRTGAEVRAAIDAGADAVGFVFVRSSPRYIDPDTAAEFTCMLPPFIDAVGLFADQKAAEICRLAGEACVEIVQLHGREDPQCVQLVRDEFAVIKGIRYSADTLRQWAGVDSIDMLLVDGSDGGQGETLDWAALAAQRDLINAPLMLAGGLTAGNVAEAIIKVQPYAVDVSSGVESRPGVKDPALIHQFCAAVRAADQTRGR